MKMENYDSEESKWILLGVAGILNDDNWLKIIIYILFFNFSLKSILKSINYD